MEFMPSTRVIHSKSSRAKRDAADQPSVKRTAEPGGSERADLARPFKLAPTVSIAGLLDNKVGGDSKFRQLLYDIAITASHLESARAHLAARMGITSPQYNMVMIIARNEVRMGISVSEVAARLHVTTTFVTAEIKKLMRLGMVTKESNPADARSVLLRLTPDGEARVRALEPELLFVNDHLFRHLSKADFQHLSRIVASLIDDFSRTIALLGAVTAGAPGPRAEHELAVASLGFDRLMDMDV